MSVAGLLWLLGAFALRPSVGDKSPNNKPVDLLKAVESLPNGVLLEATIDVPMLECMWAVRSELNVSAREVTYTWLIKGQNGKPGKDIPVKYVISKSSPDESVAFFISDKSKPIRAQAIYSEEARCLIMRMFWGTRDDCLLWWAPQSGATAPKSCTTAFKKKCGDGVLLYKKDVCK